MARLLGRDVLPLPECTLYSLTGTRQLGSLHHGKATKYHCFGGDRLPAATSCNSELVRLSGLDILLELGVLSFDLVCRRTSRLSSSGVRKHVQYSPLSPLFRLSLPIVEAGGIRIRRADSYGFWLRGCEDGRQIKELTGVGRVTTVAFGFVGVSTSAPTTSEL
jgi:hypothetical protein